MMSTSNSTSTISTGQMIQMMMMQHGQQSQSGGADAASMLNQQLASALSTVGGYTGSDGQYWDESMSPTAVRQELQAADPSNPASQHVLLRGCKWLLASISKGRNVSDFFPVAVKLVGTPNLEVRKMVYMFIIHYANADRTTRELSLLSINSFQRGMADPEPLIRALALRVLTSIQLQDILQIQCLGVQKCARDKSPYVRKAACTALAKLYPQCDAGQRQVLEEMLRAWLDTDHCTMVLTSALISFEELCPDRLDWLHTSYRKICHLITDMDEWGQVVVLDILTRYVRTYFRKPSVIGTAERIDQERRVQRTLPNSHFGGCRAATATMTNNADSTMIFGALEPTAAEQAAAAGVVLPARSGTSSRPDQNGIGRHRRNVVRKGFYSDEEEEDDDEDQSAAATAAAVLLQQTPVAVQHDVIPAAAINPQATEDEDLAADHRLALQSAMPLLKSRNAAVVLQVCSFVYYTGVASVYFRSRMGKALVRIHRSHREIQHVVLASVLHLCRTCPSAFSPYLQDFLVKAVDTPRTRLYKLEILVSLSLEPASIQTVLRELRTYCAWSSDVDFSCAAVRAVGRVAEMARVVHDRHGARNTNTSGGNNSSSSTERAAANVVCLNCMAGLLTLTRAHDSVDADPAPAVPAVIGQAVIVLQQLLQMLWSDGTAHAVEDPNQIRKAVLQRVLLLLMHTLNDRAAEKSTREGRNDDDDDDDGDDESDVPTSRLKKLAVVLPAEACAAALWVVGEYWLHPTFGIGCNAMQMRVQVARCLARSFLHLDPVEKEQAMHYSAKMLVSSSTSQHQQQQSQQQEGTLCEFILSMGRHDVNPVVRDAARCTSNILHATDVGLRYDRDAMETGGASAGQVEDMMLLQGNGGSNGNKGSDATSQLKSALPLYLQCKPACSSIPLREDDSSSYRFGTLSSLVGHTARSYQPLPPWASKNSPDSLREPAEAASAAAAASNTACGATAATTTADGWTVRGPNNPASASRQAGGFYQEDDDGDDSSSSSSESSSSSSDSDSSGDDSSDEEEDDSSSSSSDNDNNRANNSHNHNHHQTNSNNHNLLGMTSQPQPQPTGNFNGLASAAAAPKVTTVIENGESFSSNDDDSSSSDDDDSEDKQQQRQQQAPSTLDANLIPMAAAPAAATSTDLFGNGTSATAAGPRVTATSSAADDLKGLVMAPIVVEDTSAEEHGPTETNMDRDSSSWHVLIRPEHAAGLLVKVRYLRGTTKAQQATVLGLTAESPTTVCLQVRVENQKREAASIRRLRWVSRSGGGSGGSGSTIRPARVVLPNEILELPRGQRADALLGIQFASASDRDGSFQAKFDVKYGTGGIPVEIKPTLGEMLQPCRRTAAEFDAAIQQLHGFQRVQANVAVPPRRDDDDKTSSSGLVHRILGCAALTAVGSQREEDDWSKNGDGTTTLRMAGTLPCSGDAVYVSLLPPKKKKGGSGDNATLIVCCDHALAVNSILNLVQRALKNNK